MKIGDKVAYLGKNKKYKLGIILNIDQEYARVKCLYGISNKVKVENLKHQTTEILEQIAKDQNVLPQKEYVVPIEKRGSRKAPDPSFFFLSLGGHFSLDLTRKTR